MIIIVEIAEEVIECPKSLLAAWKSGDKLLVPDGLIDIERAWRHIRNQTSSHFGESGKNYIPKVYELDLKNYTGKRLS